MELHVLSIGFMKNCLDLSVGVMNALNESGGFFSLKLNMGRVYVCSGKR
jgi:hypothetical protein